MSHWMDRLTQGVAPRWTLNRIRARAATQILARHYEAAATGRRTQGWTRQTGDANAVLSAALKLLRDHARDLARNNPYAESALTTIADHAVGWGVTAKPARTAPARIRTKALDLWKAWAETTACDADGRENLYGLQKLVMRTVAESGEVLIRRRIRRPEDNLPLPLQLQVLEPDYLDPLKDALGLPNGGSVIQGIEFDPIGRRTAYWMLRQHPGASLPAMTGFGVSDRIPASEILHVFKRKRPGQIRGASWFAPVTLRLKDFDAYEDAALVKQKVAACLAVITSDVDGSSPALGATDSADPTTDTLEPGMIMNAPPGRSVSVVNPPSINEHKQYAETVLRAIATGLGMTYEDLTGDYSTLTFSAARMSRLRHWARVDDWRWQMLIPQFCDPVWKWAMESAQVMGLEGNPSAEWSAPPIPMIEPDKEGLAYQRNIRTGIMSLSEAIRERGYDPEDLLDELSEDFKRLDKLGLILDSDPRNTTQAGNPRATAAAGADEKTDTSTTDTKDDATEPAVAPVEE